MIELEDGTLSQETKDRLIQARNMCIESGKVLSKKDLVPIELRNKETGIISHIGLFKKLSTTDYRDVYNVMVAENDSEKAKTLSSRLKTKGLFQTCIDACASSIVCPDKDDFRKWSANNQFGVVNIASLLLNEGRLDEEASKSDWDFF